MRFTGMSLILLTQLVAAGHAAADQDTYREEVQAWRQQREKGLKADDGWLTLVGLHWLKPGKTRLGSESTNDVRLPESAPSNVGSLEIDGEKIQFRAEPGVNVTRAGVSFTEGELRSDAKGKPDILTVGAIRLIVIRRGERFALRLKDNQSLVRSGFTGLKWYPVDESWRIRARFEPSKVPSSIVMDTIVGTRDSFDCPGWAVFERDGKEYRLEAAREGEKLWFVFRDATAGRTTSSNARQLLADLPGADGVVILDFNRAANLPCAYTPHATCPIAPKQNRLPFAIPAGEQLYVSP